jgi:radical SAM superfamily enzyme YgiQ (UPF0313 family)
LPHLLLVPLTGFRIRDQELLALGMSLPGLAPRARAIGQLPALGLLTLAGMLPEHWTCEYLPAARGDAESTSDWADQLADRRPELVAISALTASIDDAYRLCDLLKARGITTVLGGLHATACPAEAARHASIVAVGSGELVWPDILADVERGQPRPIYRAARRLGPADWPVPRYDLLGPDIPRFTLQTQRGCPLACDFCAASRLLSPFAEKPLAAIERELAAIGRFDPRPLVELADDNTFAGRRDVGELFAAFRQARIRYFTEADWRIGRRPDVLAGLADSGCVQVLMGLESLVFRYPGMGGKDALADDMLAAACRLQEHGVAVNGCFIVGADGETRHSLDRLARFLADCPLADVQLTLQTPFPGTPLHARLHREGRLLPSRPWSAYTLFDVTYQPDQMTVADLETGFRDLLLTTYSPAATSRRTQIRRNILRQRADMRDVTPTGGASDE